MKIKLLIATFASASLVISPAFAERSEKQQALLEGSTFASLAVAGVVAGGPVGMVVGAVTGALLANETRKANDNEIALSQSQTSAHQLEQELMQTEQNIAQLQQDLVAKMTFQVLFGSGEDTLTELDAQRVEKLAHYLLDNPKLDVNLDGHSDIRGTDEYNNVLSIERANTVKEALISYGVEATRITCQGYGSSFATATKGDLPGLAKDRKVMIQLAPTANEASVAQF